MIWKYIHIKRSQSFRVSLFTWLLAVPLHAQGLPRALPAVHIHPQAFLVGGYAAVVTLHAADQPRVGSDLSGHHRVEVADGGPRHSQSDSVLGVVGLAVLDVLFAYVNNYKVECLDVEASLILF